MAKIPMFLLRLSLVMMCSLSADETQAELTSKGKQLDLRYTNDLNHLRDELREALGKVKRNDTADTFLESDKLDAKLVKFVILNNATPRELAEFAQKSAVHEKLITDLLGDKDLMIQMMVADGPRPVNAYKGSYQYGSVIKIYKEIQKSNPKTDKGLLQRLALAVALEHSVPVQQQNPKGSLQATEFVDPIKRYQHYEKAYLEGELDPCFKNLSVWELRMVVNGHEPDETLSWGRKMMQNYRPDHVTSEQEGWRYVRIVSSDVNYGSGDVKYDLPELQFFQNILMNGGICGRRAFFGRFILRAFGVPTIARPSRGHGALARFTTKGWVVCLGPGWGSGWTRTRYISDTDFLATTQARKDRKAFMQVKRAQWSGDVLGEKRVYGEKSKHKPAFWNKMALQAQRSIIARLKAKPLKALGTNLGEANGNSVEKGTAVEVTESDKKIKYDRNGNISIAAAAFKKKHSRGITTMKSYDGGLQVFLPGFGLEGKTLLRGGSWKGDANACSSGWRLQSGGYGQYENWGFRVALTKQNDKAAKEITLQLTDEVSMEFVYIQPGSFMMGGESKTDGRWQCVELPKHKVNITKGFYLGKYEVTQEQFKAVMGYNASRSTKDPNCPVDNVSRLESLRFCEEISFKMKREVRLPTEAEWEYAARAGSSEKWFFGGDPSKLYKYAWSQKNAENKSHKVGLKEPNPWGLYDIYGNVVERVADIYKKDYYAHSPKNDPKGPVQASATQFEYEVDAANSGVYFLKAMVVTNKYSQKITLELNSSVTDLELPFTLGDWQESKPVKVYLKQGKNILRFYRNEPPQKGMAVKYFILEPVRS